ncbi:growth-regulating factor 1-like [Cucurbita maxima]|uniref:Growth-regulating factor n=1 Tax=Cucurbita maxima TaxID=3661 RepID=A0A6J1K8C6_CUCMA|nr:growth-regulating factor 1-like [Cucurbita maxima]
MDFGVVGLDGVVVGSSHDTSGFSSLASSDPETKQKWYESGVGFLQKQERSGSGAAAEDEDLRTSKLPKTYDDLSSSSSSTKGLLFPHRQVASLLRSNSPFFLSDSNQHPHQMLCFSSPKTDPLPPDKTSSLSRVSPNFYHSSAPRNAGCNYGGLNGGSMNGSGFIGVRAPFTPSQWMELEHQALIYKYITANVPVPSNLLIPIRKALESTGFSAYSAGFLRPGAVGWGSFNMGFSNNSDPEPGRCRRTDGKKWRCSRDAVADQKYCERHMNRGRHRSRKPVESQAGHSHSVARASNITTAANATKLISSSASAAAVPSNASSNTLSFADQHFKNIQCAESHPPPSSTTAQINRMLITNKENGSIALHDTPTTSGFSVLSPSIEMKQQPKQLPFAVQKQQNPFEESARAEFGLVSSNFLLNQSQKASSLMNYRGYNPSEGISSTQEAAETQHSVRQFFNNWPKNQSDSSSVSWSNSNLDLQSDRTQLSISIPMATSDFRSSTSSPANEKVTLSPLKSLQEMDPLQMGLGVGNVMDEPNSRQTNWIPISWESSMGGPLGEVLQSTNNIGGELKSSSILNLMTEGWDNSPSLGSSPTGVLQKTAFGSFSNSSTGSSPRTENNKTHEGGGGGGGSSQCSDRFVNSSSSLPSV